MTTPVVLDASAGVELLLNTSAGRALRMKLPRDGVDWAPEHYFAEVAAVLRRLELAEHVDSARVGAALDRLLVAPARRAQVRPLLL